jgi:hypothetical protein
VTTPVYGGYPPRPRPPGAVLIGGRILTPVPAVAHLFKILEASFREPFRGVTTDGHVVPGLYALTSTGDSPAAAVQAARRYLAAVRGLPQIPGADRSALPLTAADRRMWTNAFPTWAPAGIRLADMPADVRALALEVLAGTLSQRGFAQTRDVMKLNQALGELIRNDCDGTLREWTYWFTIFGEPGGEEPWGWQLMGHHLDLNVTFIGDQIAPTPMFMGAEIGSHGDGPMHEDPAFGAEREMALELVQSLDSGQRDQAVLFSSMLSAALPPDRRHPTEGRQRGAAGADNLVLPYEGLVTGGLSAAQRDQLLNLVRVYLSRLPPGNEGALMRAVTEHLEQTHFTWIGDTSGAGPFYYKVHSPVILVEFDHHSGVFLANDEPEPFHVHTVVRLPNGGDYGMDLLRLHKERFHARPQTTASGS